MEHDPQVVEGWQLVATIPPEAGKPVDMVVYWRSLLVVTDKGYLLRWDGETLRPISP